MHTQHPSLSQSGCPCIGLSRLLQSICRHSNLALCSLLLCCPSPLPAPVPPPPPRACRSTCPKRPLAGLCSGTTACTLHAYRLIGGFGHTSHSFSRARTLTTRNLFLWFAALPCKAQIPRDCQHPQVPSYQGQPGMSSMVPSTPKAMPHHQRLLLLEVAQYMPFSVALHVTLSVNQPTIGSVTSSITL